MEAVGGDECAGTEGAGVVGMGGPGVEVRKQS